MTGGSQGAQRLNDAASGGGDGTCARPASRCCTPPARRSTVTVARPARSPPYVVLPYLDRMDLAYAAADLVLCRAGANTVAELTAVGLPAAYVPLPIGNGEQGLNARPVVEAGGGLLVDDPACTPAWVRDDADPAARWTPTGWPPWVGRPRQFGRPGRRRAAGRPGARGGRVRRPERGGDGA